MSEQVIDRLAEALRGATPWLTDEADKDEIKAALAEYDEFRKLTPPLPPLKPLDHKCPYCGAINPGLGVASLTIVDNGAMLAIFYCSGAQCHSVLGVQMIRMPRGFVELADRMPGGHA
jgi:hypothetical protein